MKKIVCELCDSTEFVKEGGMFICQGCGTKYTAEEAKSLMKEVEGASAVSGGATTVTVSAMNPNQQQIENILILASTAYEASNLQESETYCNKAIELDVASYKAWFLKGKAIGWSSTMGKLRIEEAVHSFCKAIDFAPEDERNSIKAQAVEEIQKLGLALVGTRKSRFIESPQSEVEGFKADMKTIYGALDVLSQYGNAVDMPQEYLHQICTIIYEAGVEASKKADDAYLAKSYPEASDYCEYAGSLLSSIVIIKFSIELNDNEDDEIKLERYTTISNIFHMPSSAKPRLRAAYKKEWNSYLSEYVYNVDKLSMGVGVLLIGKGIAEMFKDKSLGYIIDSLEKKVKENKKAERKKAEEAKQTRIKAYWEAHADEKAKLDAEKQALTDKKSKLNAEIADLTKQIGAAQPSGNVPSEDETSKLKDQIKELENQRAKLGIFAGKEKKRISEEIASLQGRIDSLKSKIDEEKKARTAEVDKKLAPIKAKKNELEQQVSAAEKRISAIEAELAKDPEA